jgi:hypothetical protein
LSANRRLIVAEIREIGTFRLYFSAEITAIREQFQAEGQSLTAELKKPTGGTEIIFSAYLFLIFQNKTL